MVMEDGFLYLIGVMPDFSSNKLTFSHKKRMLLFTTSLILQFEKDFSMIPVWTIFSLFPVRLQALFQEVGFLYLVIARQ